MCCRLREDRVLLHFHHIFLFVELLNEFRNGFNRFSSLVTVSFCFVCGSCGFSGRFCLPLDVSLTWTFFSFLHLPFRFMLGYIHTVGVLMCMWRRHVSTCYRLAFRWHLVRCLQKRTAFIAYSRAVVAYVRIKCYKIHN